MPESSLTFTLIAIICEKDVYDKVIPSLQNQLSYSHKMRIRLASAAHKIITTITKNMIRYFISKVSVCTVR